MVASLAALVLSAAVQADDGFYGSTKHGSPTQGVQRDTTVARGTCAQCHSGHGEGTFSFGLWTENDNNLCFTCHGSGSRSYSGQTGYALSGHAVSISTFNQAPVGNCVQCHNPHGAGDAKGAHPNLAARHEEQVCYSCHGTGFRPQNAVDIQTATTKRYAHAVSGYERLHDDAGEFGSVASAPHPGLSGSRRHVECSDCHNTHVARSARKPERTSNVGESMLGTWGARPVYSGSPWTAPAGYVTERFQSTTTSLESHLCFKCHSNYAWGGAAPYTSDGVLETNTAMEFSPDNPSYHNVTGQASAYVPTDDFVFGTARSPAYVNQWGANSAMACTDCHASDDSTGADGGPHGSSFQFLLKKRFAARAGASDNTGRLGTRNDLCFDCHDWNTYGEGGSGRDTNFSKGSDNLHTKENHARAGCFQCHSAVPHGFKRKHMIVYVADGPPYYQSDPTNHATTTGGIEKYAPADGGAYTVNNCTAGCHQGHQKTNPTNPLP